MPKRRSDNSSEGKLNVAGTKGARMHELLMRSTRDCAHKGVKCGSEILESQRTKGSPRMVGCTSETGRHLEQHCCGVILGSNGGCGVTGATVTERLTYFV